MPGITHQSNMNGYGESSRYDRDRDYRNYGMNGGGFEQYSSADPPDYTSSRRPLGETYHGGEDNFPSSRHPDTFREEYYSSSRRPLGVGDGYGGDTRRSEFRLTLPHDLHSPRDDYGRTNNGFSRDMDQSSLDGMRGSCFDVDHLATFTTSKDRPMSGPITFEDALKKLKHMEVQSGVWTMRCELVVEPGCVVINEKGSGEEYERFPLHHLHDPVAILKDDRQEVHTNLILFTICEDPKRKSGISDMHIFQSVERPAQDIVDEILAAKKGRRPMNSGPMVPPPPMGPAPNPPHLGVANWINKPTGKYHFYKYPGGSYYTNGGLYPGKLEEFHTKSSFSRSDQDYHSSVLHQPDYNQELYSMSQRPTGPSPNRASYIPPIGEDMDAGLNERLEKNVQLLNFCFDDIEKFVSRLQAAAEAYKELERRRRERSAKKMKNRQSGEGLLNMKARPPPAEDFIDIFQKFKFAFNLLSDLKAHIHDPNAPELVHFLFTPLSLIYEASRDPVHGGVDLADNARSPLLTSSTKELLLNCLTSKELELWQALGRHWTNSREEIKEYVEPFNPRFYNGISPSPPVMPMPMDRNKLEMAVANMDHQTQQRARDFDRRQEEPMPFTRGDDRGFRSSMIEDRGFRSTVMDDRGFRPTMDDRGEDNLYARSTKPNIAPPPGALSKSNVTRYQDYVDMNSDRNKNAHQPPPDSYRPEPPSYRPEPKPRSRSEENQQFHRKLINKGAPQIYEVVHDREGRNAKEITVLKGDLVEVLDSQRNWWRIANCYGDEGYAPYTILRKVNKESGDIYSTTVNADRTRNSGEYNSYISQGQPHHNIPDPPPIDSARMGGDSPREYDDRIEDRRRNLEDDRSDRSFEHRRDDSFDDRYSDDDRRSADRYRQDRYDEQSNDSRGNGNRYNYDSNDISRQKYDRNRSDFNDRDSNDGDGYRRDIRRGNGANIIDNRRDRRADDGYDDRFNAHGQRQIDRRNEREMDRNGHNQDDRFNGRRNDLRDPQQRDRRDELQNDRRGERQMERKDERMAERNDRQMDRREERQNVPQVVPPPPPPTSRLSALKKTQPNRQERPKSPKNDLHSELVKRMSTQNLVLPKSATTVYISRSSDEEEVQEWLQAKGFSRRCAETLSGYTGEDLFQMRRSEMNRLLGQDESHRLESLVTVQKKISNFETVNPAKVELTNILQERKKRAEKNTADTGFISRPPAFAPESPDYSDNDSDSSEDDFADAGKTLRALLQQQRKRIHKSTYEQH